MKTIFVMLFLWAFTSQAGTHFPKRVLMMVSEGFYAPEYYKPLKAFKEAGFLVTTATKYNRPTKPDERQLQTASPVIPDLTFKQINANDYDAIVFAGGNGAWEDFFPNRDVHKALTSFMGQKKLVALLCSSTGLLGFANNLDAKGTPIAKGAKTTGYEKVEGILTVLGKVNLLTGDKNKPFVVTDGNLITGRDPMSSNLFAETIIHYLNRIDEGD